MTQIYGYIRTSLLLQEGVPWENLFRDIGVSGSTGTEQKRSDSRHGLREARMVNRFTAQTIGAAMSNAEDFEDSNAQDAVWCMEAILGLVKTK